jgi:hypothetical protein
MIVYEFASGNVQVIVLVTINYGISTIVVECTVIDVYTSIVNCWTIIRS